MTDASASAVTDRQPRLLAAPVWYALAACALLAHAVSAWQLADNLPKFDDLNDAFGFFRQLALANTGSEKILAFFYPNNEHITATNHLIYFLQYQLLGTLDFRPLVLLGHLVILATALLLGLSLPATQRPFAIAIVSLCYANLHSWDSSFKAMTALSNQSVIFFAVASLGCLLHAQRFWLAVLLAFAATFSQGNGVLVWFAALPALLNRSVALPRYSATLWLSAAALATLGTVLIKQHFDFPNAITGTLLLTHWAAQPLLPLQAIAVFLGSTGWQEQHVLLAGSTGTIALGLCLWQLRHWLRAEPFAASVLLFLLGSAAVAAVMRVLSTNELAGAMASRYRMYSLAFLPMVVLLSVSACRNAVTQRSLVALLAALALTIHLSAYRHSDAVREQTARFRDSYATWLVDGDFHRQTIYFPPMSDHFLFVAHQLQLLDLLSLGNMARADFHPAPDQQPCPAAPAAATGCPVAITHRGNAIAVAVAVTMPLSSAAATATLCADEQLFGTLTLPLTDSQEQRWLLPEALLPPGQYRVLWPLDNQHHCETTLLKKPRKVTTEMQALFGH